MNTTLRWCTYGRDIALAWMWISLEIILMHKWSVMWIFWHGVRIDMITVSETSAEKSFMIKVNWRKLWLYQIFLHENINGLVNGNSGGFRLNGKDSNKMEFNVDWKYYWPLRRLEKMIFRNTEVNVGLVLLTTANSSWI